MLHRIRLAMQDENFGSKLGGNGGEIEEDETFIGGKARNMHKDVKARRIAGQGQAAKDKLIVMGILAADAFALKSSRIARAIPCSRSFGSR